MFPNDVEGKPNLAPGALDATKETFPEFFPDVSTGVDAIYGIVGAVQVQVPDRRDRWIAGDEAALVGGIGPGPREHQPVPRIAHRGGAAEGVVFVRPRTFRLPDLAQTEFRHPETGMRLIYELA